MLGPVLGITSLLAATLAETDPGKRDAVRRLWWLWIVLIFIAMVLLLTIMAISRYRRRVTSALNKPAKRPEIKDAWTEAGKRAEPIPEDLLDDEEEA